MVIVPTRTRAPHRVYLVRPIGDFSPRDWRQRPQRFTIVRRLETTARIGKADATKWLHNAEAIKGRIETWAVILPPQRDRRTNGAGA